MIDRTPNPNCKILGKFQIVSGKHQVDYALGDLTWNLGTGFGEYVVSTCSKASLNALK